MSPVDARVEVMLLQVLVQLAVIIAAARICGALFRRLGQPQVCGEIAAGLLLGPSVFGRAFPELAGAIFDPGVAPTLSVVSQIGVILLMFLIGLEFDFTHLRTQRRAAASISLAGIVVPFTLGLLTAAVLYPHVGGGVSRLGFTLFIATALSITALPILGRMLVEFNLHRTRLGCVAISAAAFDDIAGWTLLATVTALVRTEFSPRATFFMIGSTVLFGLVMLKIVRPVLCRWATPMLRQHGGGDMPLSVLAVVLVCVIASAAVTNVIGLFSIFGGFAVGAILFDQHELKEALLGRLRDFVTVFFLPVFFTLTGLRTDIGSMSGGLAWGLCLLLLAAAVAGKLGGCFAAARIAGFPRQEAVAIGLLMNTRALMELVVVNVGYEIGVIPRSVFFMLVLMAVVTTYMTTPLVRRALRDTAFSGLVERSLVRAPFGRPVEPSPVA